MSDTLPRVEGNVWVFGDDIDTDIIIPWEYAHLEPAEYAKHAMEPADENFAEKIADGDIIVAGANFGSGSSREHAAIALKEAGIGAVIAESFGRIFYRNAINQGLPVIQCDENEIEALANEEHLIVDLESGVVITESESEISFDSYKEPVRSILAAGGAKAFYTQS